MRPTSRGFSPCRKSWCGCPGLVDGGGAVALGCGSGQHRRGQGVGRDECSGESWPCRENCSAAIADRGVISCSGGFGGAPTEPPSSSSLSLLWLGVKWFATGWRRKARRGLGPRFQGFYSGAHPWSSVNGGWRSRGDRRASSEAGLGFWGRGAIVGVLVLPNFVDCGSTRMEQGW